jgi:hypothetical protein
MRGQPILLLPQEGDEDVLLRFAGDGFHIRLRSAPAFTAAVDIAHFITAATALSGLRRRSSSAVAGRFIP